MWVVQYYRLESQDGIKGKQGERPLAKAFSVSLLPGHHDENCSGPLPIPHHDELNPKYFVPATKN
jgi:hypothetical protein